MLPLFAVETLEPEEINNLPEFRRRMDWFLTNQPDIANHLDQTMKTEKGTRYLLSLVNRERLPRLLHYLLDEREFLSPHGVRSLSKYHQDHPYILNIDGVQRRVAYEPAESRTGMFGGNSNWRGPVWFPHELFADRIAAEISLVLRRWTEIRDANGIGKAITLWQIAQELSRKMSRLFLRQRRWISSRDGGIGSISQRSALARFDFV